MCSCLQTAVCKGPVRSPDSFSHYDRLLGQDGFRSKAGTWNSSVKIIPAKIFNDHCHSVGSLVSSPIQDSPKPVPALSPIHSQPSQTPTRHSSWDLRGIESSESSASFASCARPSTQPLLTYQLEVIQQPQRAAEFGSSLLTRLPLAPPLIVQLVVRDLAGNIYSDDDEHPFLISHLSLFTGDDTMSLATLSPSDNPYIMNESRGLLYGSLVSSPQIYRDLQGRQGTYFLFPDVSIRTRGHFQIRISLLRLPSTEPDVTDHFDSNDSILAETFTGTFQVLAREDYIAPPQTHLTRYLLQQGARMYAFETSIPH